MTGPIQREIHMDALVREALRKARALNVYRVLLAAYPTAAGALNRVAECIGEEIPRPGSRKPLLVAGWADTPNTLREAGREIGTNDPRYLIVALTAILTPLREALALEVTINQSHWHPANAPDWRAWRAEHPGKIKVKAAPGAVDDERRVVLERWALGHFFTDMSEINEQWPASIAKAG